MTIFHCDLHLKFGEAWLSERGLNSLGKNTRINGSVLIVCHGPPSNQVKQLANSNESVWVLFLSSGTPPKHWRDHFTEAGRVHLLKYGVRSVDTFDPQAWQQQVQWIVRKFDAFIKAAKDQQSGDPPWHLLNPPRAPEFVICSYLCGMAEQGPDPSWENQFREEVTYWRSKQNSNLRLEWRADSRCLQKLRKFLEEVGILHMGNNSGLAPLFDVLLFPNCEVAEKAVNCWHDIIKDLKTYGDKDLEIWLADKEKVSRFEAALTSVASNLGGYSPANAAKELEPISHFAAHLREDLFHKLQRRFEQEFSLTDTQALLQAMTKELIRCLYENSNGSDGADRLGRFRTAAQVVGSLLETFPEGYWMPCPPNQR